MNADWPAARIGLSPFASPLRVLHVLPAGARTDLEPLLRVHRDHGWTVELRRGSTEHFERHDVIVFHGLEAARLRQEIRGRITTVVVAGDELPSGLGWFGQARLARYTNAVVLTDPEAASRWASRVLAPLTQVDAVDGRLDPVQFATVLARAEAWGGAQ